MDHPVQRHVLRPAITLQKQDQFYLILRDGVQIGSAELYDNPYHRTNCYVRLRLRDPDPAISAQLFANLQQLANRPLQVMVSSSNTAMTAFLLAGGFVLGRKCWEVDADADDYVGSRIELPMQEASAGQPAYDQCGRMLYAHYQETHKAVNPWTADEAAFFRQLPETAFYGTGNGRITSLAFTEENEIAYVCGTDRQQFTRFSQALVTKLLKDHARIAFECDDCDWAAMQLRGLFQNQSEESYDTYILNDCK